MEQQYTCGQITLIVLALTFVYYAYMAYFTEGYTNFTSFHHTLPNRNAFTNYYRVGFERSRDLGWKPHESWDHLRPEYNECPECFHKDQIY